MNQVILLGRFSFQEHTICSFPYIICTVHRQKFLLGVFLFFKNKQTINHHKSFFTWSSGTDKYEYETFETTQHHKRKIKIHKFLGIFLHSLINFLREKENCYGEFTQNKNTKKTIV